MKNVILKAKPYWRTTKGRVQFVRGYYGETDFTKEQYLLGKYGDKAVLELRVEK